MKTLYSKQQKTNSMNVFVYRYKDDNRIAIVRTMTDKQLLSWHKNKENVLRIIEQKNADEKDELKVELIEDPVLIEIMEWIARSSPPIIIEGAKSLKRRLEDLEDAAFDLESDIIALKKSIFDSQSDPLLGVTK